MNYRDQIALKDKRTQWLIDHWDEYNLGNFGKVWDVGAPGGAKIKPLFKAMQNEGLFSKTTYWQDVNFPAYIRTIQIMKEQK